MKTSRYSSADWIWLVRVFSALLLSLIAWKGYAGVESLAGRYEGAWTNLTFNSTGRAVIDIQIAGATAAINFDMDGFVFGFIDPPLITMPGTVAGNSIQIDNHGVGIFGDISGSINADAGTYTADLSNIPGGYINHINATGTIANGVIKLNYTVDFPGNPSPTNPANGVLVATASIPLTITSVVRQGTDIVIQWTGGKPSYQLQVRPNLSSGTWNNRDAPTTLTTARISIGAQPTVFVRVAGQ